MAGIRRLLAPLTDQVKEISMPTNKRRPGDLTGMIKDKLSEEYAEQQRENAGKVTLIEPPPGAVDENEIELADTGTASDKETAGEIEVVQEEVDVSAGMLRAMRVNDRIEQMTYGNGEHGQMYDFEPGYTYRVPEAVYKHLDEKGYVWH